MTEEQQEPTHAGQPETVAPLTQDEHHVRCQGPAMRVLLVEDNQDYQRLIEHMLGNLGVHAVLAQNGQQGFEAVLQGEPAQLVLMDLHMPRFDGNGAPQQIRLADTKNGHSRRAILAVAAYTDLDERERCLAAGMDDMLLKPVSFEKLKSVLAQWLPQERHADTNRGDSF